MAAIKSQSFLVPIGLVAGVTLLALFCTSRHQDRIEADIAQRSSLGLGRVPGSEDVQVLVEDGRDVVLAGTVSSEILARQAIRVVELVDGVRRVRSVLHVTYPIDNGGSEPALRLQELIDQLATPFQEAPN
jgi:hypothetical protein